MSKLSRNLSVCSSILVTISVGDSVSVDFKEDLRKCFLGSHFLLGTGRELNVHEKKLYGPFFDGWRSTASRLEPLRGGSLLFITKKFLVFILSTSEG